MREPSFRRRVAMLSAGLSGLVLLVVCGSGWLLVARFGMRGVDHELVSRIQPEFRNEWPPEHWPQVQAAFEYIYADRDATPPILLVRRPDGALVYGSPQWPTGIDLRAGGPPPPPRRGLPPLPPGGGPPPRRPPPLREGRPPPQAPPPLLLGPPPPFPADGLRPPQFQTWHDHGHAWRLCTLAGPRYRITLGISLGPLHGQMAFARNGFLILVPVALLLLAGASWLTTGKALGAVERLAAVAESVTAASLDRRIPTAGVEVEFQRVIVVLNDMLDRLERSFQQAARFSADAAHELKTPLTILQGQLEQALRAAPPDSEEQSVLAGLLEEVQRLKAIVQKLLLLALADAGKLKPPAEPVDLTRLVAAVVEDVEFLGPHLKVAAELQPDVRVRGDADLLQQLVGNLAGNAVKYNRPEGTVALRLRVRGGRAELAVANTGPGIPPGDRERVFERFYRADPARGREVEGVGLGLSLAREIARAHGGELVLAESAADRTIFRLTLPLLTTP